jgi:hypothetical protein
LTRFFIRYTEDMEKKNKDIKEMPALTRTVQAAG